MFLLSLNICLSLQSMPLGLRGLDRGYSCLSLDPPQVTVPPLMERGIQALSATVARLPVFARKLVELSNLKMSSMLTDLRSHQNPSAESILCSGTQNKITTR